MGQLTQAMGGGANASGGLASGIMGAVGQGLQAGGSGESQAPGASMLNALQQVGEKNDKKDLRNQMLLQALQQLSR